MKITLYQVDAFAEILFGGNPAAVCPLPSWLPDAQLQAIAAENNLSETAFFVARGASFELRWFTPVAEVDLCGHATLATAHVLFRHLGHAGESLRFQTRSGELRVTRTGAGLQMDFPARPPRPATPPAALLDGLHLSAAEVWAADDYLVVLPDEAAVRALVPDLALLRRVDLRGVIITAPGSADDFVSRFFAPKYGIDEDPVTGSAHCTLAPYWAARLGRTDLRARQVSKRGGVVLCTVSSERVLLAGQAITYLVGEMDLSQASQ
jgi:PhzF family phenazine biosynthesis protein